MFSLKSTLNFPISINAITAHLITPAPDLSIISPSIPLFKSPYRVATDMTSQNSPSTFILNSSLHSSQDFRNRNQTILFACFKFPVKSKLLSWLAKPCFLSGHYPLWNSTSRAQCASFLRDPLLQHSELVPRVLAPPLFFSQGGSSPDLRVTMTAASVHSASNPKPPSWENSEHLIWYSRLVTGFHKSVISLPARKLWLSGMFFSFWLCVSTQGCVLHKTRNPSVLFTATPVLTPCLPHRANGRL